MARKTWACKVVGHDFFLVGTMFHPFRTCTFAVFKDRKRAKNLIPLFLFSLSVPFFVRREDRMDREGKVMVGGLRPSFSRQ